MGEMMDPEWKRYANSLNALSEKIGTLVGIEYGMQWWEADYIANRFARDAIKRIHENMTRYSISFETPKDIFKFVKANPKEAEILIDNTIRLIEMFTRYHNYTTWKTIDLSHAQLMCSLFAWNGILLERPSLHEPMEILEKKYIVVSSPETNSNIRVTDLQSFLTSCEPLNPNIVPNIDRVMLFIDECITYSGSERFVDRSLKRFFRDIVSVAIKIHNANRPEPAFKHQRDSYIAYPIEYGPVS
jgi:hypothetical protein